MVTVVQSWQSGGALCSGLLYLFFDIAGVVYIVSRDRFISVYGYGYADILEMV